MGARGWHISSFPSEMFVERFLERVPGQVCRRVSQRVFRDEFTDEFTRSEEASTDPRIVCSVARVSIHGYVGTLRRVVRPPHVQFVARVALPAVERPTEHSLAAPAPRLPQIGLG
eukprot:scaffold3082_cov119-Isochrysis_galbana.AAC.15